jgi:hypothetical protein
MVRGPRAGALVRVMGLVVPPIGFPRRSGARSSQAATMTSYSNPQLTRVSIAEEHVADRGFSG